MAALEDIPGILSKQIGIPDIRWKLGGPKRVLELFDVSLDDHSKILQPLLAIKDQLKREHDLVIDIQIHAAVENQPKSEEEPASEVKKGSVASVLETIQRINGFLREPYLIRAQQAKGNKIRIETPTGMALTLRPSVVLGGLQDYLEGVLFPDFAHRLWDELKEASDTYGRPSYCRVGTRLGEQSIVTHVSQGGLVIGLGYDGVEHYYRLDSLQEQDVVPLEGGGSLPQPPQQYGDRAPMSEWSKLARKHDAEKLELETVREQALELIKTALQKAKSTKDFRKLISHLSDGQGIVQPEAPRLKDQIVDGVPDRGRTKTAEKKPSIPVVESVAVSEETTSTPMEGTSDLDYVEALDAWAVGLEERPSQD